LPESASKLAQGAGTTLLTIRDKGPLYHLRADQSNLLDQAWLSNLQRGIGRLRDHLSRHHVMHILYDGDKHEAQLTTNTYLVLDLDGASSSLSSKDPMPSVVFQVVSVPSAFTMDLGSFPCWFITPSSPMVHIVTQGTKKNVVGLQLLFTKLAALAKIAADVITGREHVVLAFLARVVEVLVDWLESEGSFWSGIEDGPQMLGPKGLQQVSLSITFIQSHRCSCTEIIYAQFLLKFKLKASIRNFCCTDHE